MPFTSRSWSCANIDFFVACWWSETTGTPKFASFGGRNAVYIGMWSSLKHTQPEMLVHPYLGPHKLAIPPALRTQPPHVVLQVAPTGKRRTLSLLHPWRGSKLATLSNSARLGFFGEISTSKCRCRSSVHLLAAMGGLATTIPFIPNLLHLAAHCTALRSLSVGVLLLP